MKEHSYIPKAHKITEVKNLSPETVGFTLSGNISFHPGQFVMVGVLGYGEVPIGITASPEEKGEFQLAIRASGLVTDKICSLSVGDSLMINGPFGNGFPLSKIKGKDVVLIAGGIGLPPLRSLIRHISKNKEMVKSLKILIGAKEPEFLLYKEEYNEWTKFAEVLTTVDKPDKNWESTVGIIPELYQLAKVKTGSVIIVCGPPIMYKSVVSYFAGKRVSESDIYFLLERNMKCGIGKCQHCTCGNLYVCTDGPVFSYDQIKYNKEALLK